MPYALSTTKRKFHDILESIANPPAPTSLDTNNKQHNASTTTLPSAHEPLAKRLKYARPTSTPLLHTLTHTMRSASTGTMTRNITPSTSIQEKKPPNFAPWDRNQFLCRLETFRHVDKWMSKPDPINEVQWAKRGWTCVGKERVGCVGGCGNEVIISLEPSREERQSIDGTDPSEEAADDDYDWREEAQKELVVRYTEMIVTEHDEGCLWRRRGCDDSIHRLPLAQQSTTFPSLRHRYESLTKISPDIPTNITTPSNLSISKLILHLFHILHPTHKPAPSSNHPASPSKTPTTPKDPQPETESNSQPSINPYALTLALTGWGTDPDSPISGIATCTACFRRLGLWLYKSPSPPTSPPSSSSPSGTSSPTPVLTRLDPIVEHRPYCPWINPRSQSRAPVLMDTDLAGWEVLRDMVMRVRLPAAAGGDTGVGNATLAQNTEVENVESGKKERSKEEKDKERWARLKRLKQVFRVRRKPKGEVGGKS
ncbi:MAG: hypothetical protein Q9170_004939 [Blastenia crenularia]